MLGLSKKVVLGVVDYTSMCKQVDTEWWGGVLSFFSNRMQIVGRREGVTFWRSKLLHYGVFTSNILVCVGRLQNNMCVYCALVFL